MTSGARGQKKDDDTGRRERSRTEGEDCHAGTAMWTLPRAGARTGSALSVCAWRWRQWRRGWGGVG